jgi:hypothetical protein
MVFDAHTNHSLNLVLASARQRLLDAGNSKSAAFFTPDQVGSFQNLATHSPGDTLLHSLLFTEMEMVNGAANALNDIQKAISNAATAPTQAIARFAEYGAHLTDTFDKISIYSNESLRTLNSMLMVEASRAIDLSFASVAPTAMATLFVLSPGHKFQLSDYLNGELPPREEVALAQTLTNELAPRAANPADVSS